MELFINIDVPDLERAVAFYTTVFELSVHRRFGAAAVELKGLGSTVHLLKKAEGSLPWSNASAGRTYGRHWTPLHLDLAVPALEPAVERLLQAGGTVDGAISTTAWGRMAQAADPFGHGLCLLEFNSQGYSALNPK